MQDAYPAPVEAPDGTWLATVEASRRGLPARGPCLSLVMDRQTSHVFYRQNTGTPAIPKSGERSLESPLHERTQARIDEIGPSPASKGFKGHGWQRKPGYPGSHSEVQGANAVLRARSGAVLGDIVIYNIRTEDITATPAPTMPRCVNCVKITEGATVLTD